MKHYDNNLREKTNSLLIVYVSFHRKNNPERPSGRGFQGFRQTLPLAFKQKRGQSSCFPVRTGLWAHYCIPTPETPERLGNNLVLLGCPVCILIRADLHRTTCVYDSRMQRLHLALLALHKNSSTTRIVSFLSFLTVSFLKNKQTNKQKPFPGTEAVGYLLLDMLHRFNRVQ